MMSLRDFQELGLPFMQGLQTLRTSEMDILFLIATFLADQKFFFLLIPLIWWLWNARVGAALTIFAALNGVLNTILKDWIASPRPSEHDGIIRITEATGFSFPSGHAQLGAAIWTAFYLLLAPFYPSIRIGIAAAIALLVFISGLSRSYLGVHFPADLVGGWTIGFLFSYLVFPRLVAKDGWLDLLAHAAPTVARKFRLALVVIIAISTLSFPSLDLARAFGIIFGLLTVSPLWLTEIRANQSPTWPRWKLPLAIAGLAVIPILFEVLPRETKEPLFQLLKYSLFGIWIGSFRKIARVG